MAVTDQKIAAGANVAIKKHSVNATTAVSQKNKVFGVIRPGYQFVVLALRVFASTVAGTVSVTAFLCNKLAGLLSECGLAIDATATKFKLATAFVARANGVFVSKAITTALTFTAAHVVTKATFGVVLIQMDNTGAISTKVPAATQAYSSASGAIGALPAADAGKVAIAYIVIAALADTDWTANTSDMTNASGVTTATFVSLPALTALVSTAITPVSEELVEGVLQTAFADLEGSTTDDIVLAYTSDGTGALTNGQATVDYRARPLNGEA